MSYSNIRLLAEQIPDKAANDSGHHHDPRELVIEDLDDNTLVVDPEHVDPRKLPELRADIAHVKRHAPRGPMLKAVLREDRISDRYKIIRHPSEYNSPSSIETVVREALRTGDFPPELLSWVEGGPDIFNLIISFKSKNNLLQNDSNRLVRETANPYYLAYQEKSVLFQNRSRLIPVEGERLILLGPANAKKDLLYMHYAGRPRRVDIVDVSEEFGEEAIKACIRARIPEIHFHNKNFMAGTNSVWDIDYYNKEILGDDPTPIHILSFGNSELNKGMQLYKETKAAKRAVMRSRDSLGEGVDLTQSYNTLYAAYSEPTDDKPDPDGNYDLWEKLSKRMLAGTVGGVLDCTNLDFTKIHREEPDIREEDGYTDVRLHFYSASDHPDLKYRHVQGERRLQSRNRFLSSQKPVELLMRDINAQTDFKDAARGGFLRVVGHPSPLGLYPDVVFMQSVPA